MRAPPPKARDPLAVLRFVECGCEFAFEAEIARALPEARTADARGAVTARDAAVLVLALDFVEHQILRDDGLAFETHHFRDLRDAARTVAETRGLDHDVDGGDDDFANGLRGQREAAHR